MANNVSGQVQLLKKGTDNVFPITVPQAVVGSDGKNVDEKLAQKANLSGATFTGAVVLPSNAPQGNNDAARKAYVDNAVSNGSLVGKIYSTTSSITANATMSASHSGKTIVCSNSGAITIDITSNFSSFAEGTEIAFVRMNGDVTLNGGTTRIVMAGESSAFTTAKISEKYGMCAVKKIGSQWLLSGVVEKAS